MPQPRFFITLALAGALLSPVASARQARKAASKAPAQAEAAEPPGPTLVFEFDKGTVEIETFPTEAPKSVEHILDLVRHNFYRGQRIWWVTPALLQFGDPTTRDMTKKDSWGTNGSGHSVGVDETKMAKHKFLRGVVGLGYRPDYKPSTGRQLSVHHQGQQLGGGRQVRRDRTRHGRHDGGRQAGAERHHQVRVREGREEVAATPLLPSLPPRPRRPTGSAADRARSPRYRDPPRSQPEARAPSEISPRGDGPASPSVAPASRARALACSGWVVISARVLRVQS